PVSLNIIVQNVGQGEASDVKVNFINPPNVFPGNETFFEVERLKPNESRNIVYEFFANKKYNGNDIPIQVNITEGYGKYGQNKTLSVSLEERLSKTKLVNVDAIYEKDVEIDRVSLSSDVDKDIPEK